MNQNVLDDKSAHVQAGSEPSVAWSVKRWMSLNLSAPSSTIGEREGRAREKRVSELCAEALPRKRFAGCLLSVLCTYEACQYLRRA